MSDDLIRRQDAIDALDGEISVTGKENAETVIRYVKLVAERINRLPTAQPEQKKGKWVFEDGSPVNRELEMMETAVCSQCGETAPGYPFWECDLMLTNFCPNCGARMEGGNEDND